ncbi:MAG: ABC transporter permease [Actinomycetota bacterium]
MIRAVRTISAKDLRQRLRDKSFFLLGILTPLALAYALNLVFGGAAEGELEVRTAVVDADGSEISGELRANVLGLDGEGGIEIVDLPAAAEPEQAIDEQDLDAVIVIPEGFGQAITTGGAPRLELVENPDRPVQAGVAESILDGFAADFERTRLLAAAGARLGTTPDLEATAEDIEWVEQGLGSAVIDPSARLMAGMAIMFVFFTVGFGVTTLLHERQDGTLARLLAAPVPRDAILASKALVAYGLGVLSTSILLLAARLLIGAQWGPLLGVGALVLAGCLTAAALMAVVAGLARTPEGANATQTIIAVGLAMLGGSWFPVAGDGVLGTLARLTPHYWFLDGLERLAGASSWTVVGPSLAALVAIAVLAGAPATMLLRRRLTP